MREQQPILPATPWYESEVQVRAVIALGAQMFSIGTRILGHFVPITISGADVDSIVADLSQGAAIWVGVLAIVKRQKSAVAPLTLTPNRADVRNAANPPMIDVDPTKTKEAK